ncbi:lipopolysaccharide biosynthesis protein [Anatilimnocola floriformis]|uniref:lipopolysaccharide biosynthesis protein n=1 Tax=Anatilimnocola floriformis TaxID=2948575 RepID=UPI0020C47F59|nr:polysaccharide biosynthesis C-terminal domain-containing protein [Anatilimnocola floriformis]
MSPTNIPTATTHASTGLVARIFSLGKKLATSRLLHSSGLSIIDQALVSGTSFVTSVILGRCTGREDLGLYYLALSIVLFVRGLQEQLVSAPYMIYCGRQVKSEQSRYAASALLHQCLLSIVAVIGLAVVAWLGWGPAGIRSSLLLLLCAAPLLWMREFVRQMSFAHLDVRAAIVTDFTITLTQLGSLAYLAWLGELNVLSTLGVMGICCGLASVAWLASGRQKFNLQWSAAWNDWCRNWTFSRWALASHVLACSSPYILPWVVAATHGERETGTLGACATLVGLSNMLLIGLANYLSPKAARAYAEHGIGELKRVLWQTATMFVVGLGSISVFAFLAGHHVAAAVYGPEFIETRWIIGILSLAVLANSLGVTAGNGLWALERPSASFFADMCSMFVVIIATATLVPTFGPIGAALAQFTGTASDAVIRGFTLRRTLAEFTPKPISGSNA